MPFVRPVHVAAAGPLGAQTPAVGVVVISNPLISAPPVTAGGVQVTRTDSLPGVPSTAGGAPGVVRGVTGALVPPATDDPRRDVTGRPLALRDVDLDVFFHPRSVAVIGASDEPGRPNTTMTTAVKAFADANGASFHPVHPTRGAVFGTPCARTIAEVGGPVDLAVILTGAAVDTFEEVRNAGACFAVIFAAGFAETGREGARLEARLRALVEGGDTHLLGPNTNLNAFFHLAIHKENNLR